jgi:hypothetical protein
MSVQVSLDATCLPPSIIYSMQGPFPLEIFQGRDLIVIKMEYYDVVRVIFMNETMHPADWPHSVAGHSIGRWEGDTLVIDTIMVTNPNEFFQGGPPLSEEAHYVERIRLDGETLRAEVTIEDPVTLSAPWVARLAWVRDEGFDRMIQVDWNNDRTGTDGDTNTIEPPDDETGE